MSTYIRPSTVNIFAGPTTRTWIIVQNAKRYAVQLYHNTITGDRSLSIDGAEVSGTSGSTTMFSSTRVLVFALPEGGKGTVTINHRKTQVEYVCEYNGETIPEENDVLNGSDPSNDAINKLRSEVEAGEIGMDEKGSLVVWFRIKTLRENDEKQTRVHRRFRDFFAVNEALRSAYKGSHLLSSFPELPPRSFKLWEDHLSPEFVEKRKWQLQDWLYKISQIPRMRSNPDFLTFVGCIDNVRESSVLFPRDVSLGLRLRTQGDFVEVAALLPLPDGAPSPAQLSGQIQIGDKVSKINGEDCLGDTHEVILAKLKTAPRPMMLHFLGLFSSDGASSDVPTVSLSDFARTPAPAPITVASSPAPAPAPAPSPAPTPAPAPAPAPVADPRAVTGLIGDGISYVGTGATPRPGVQPRTGLAHHQQAEQTATTAYNGLL